jgi:penicillin-binding protein 2
MKLGSAFSDSVTQEKRMHMKTSGSTDDSWWLGMGRLLMFVTVLCILMFILLWRLFDLTVIQGHHYRMLADGNRTRELIRHAPRGILKDRTGKPLVENVPYYRLLKPCSDTGIADCVTPISREEGDMLLTEGLPPGTFLEVDYRREYLYPEIASHLIGYTGELSLDELGDEYYKLRYYRLGDRVGRTGAEAVFEDKLRGRDGKELVEVDAQGRIVRTLGRDREIAGEDITLSVDISLQQSASDAFPKQDNGAVVVTKPQTGEVLVLYSNPTFDINAFSSGLTDSGYNNIQNDPSRPLFDRAVGGVYPPGSIFKIVTSLAALEEGVIRQGTTVMDTGVITVGQFRFPNWYFIQYGRTEGAVDIIKALQRSNDIFFYKIGEWLGITKLVTWAHKVGIGKPLGIELGGEASGLMPDPAWKKERFNTPADQSARNDEWYLGDTYHISIGQGYLLVTPLQANIWTNVVANSGILCRPTIRKVTGNGKNETDCRNLNVRKNTIALIDEGMRRACETGGTGWPLFNFGIRGKGEGGSLENATSASTLNALPFSLIPVACKTGTAEYGDPKNNTHAWFTAFAPVPDTAKSIDGTGQTPVSDNINSISGDPELTVTVLVEGAGEGSSVAAPVAKKIFEEWFGR